LRKEIWFPGAAWEGWEEGERTSLGDWAVAEVKRVLDTHKPEPIDEALAREIDRIVESACGEPA
jgi:trimethylamine:corrinoid methyltransferase-like protein